IPILTAATVIRKEKEKSKTWKQVPSSKSDLRDRMIQMYWLGVSTEMVLLIRTLWTWQQERYAEVHGDDEVLQVENMDGFKTFLERAVGKGRAKHTFPIQAETPSLLTAQATSEETVSL